MEQVNEMIVSLVGLADKKKELFSKINDITLEQKKDIEENEARNIEELVNRKQQVIDVIDEIDREFSEKLNLLKKSLNIDALENADFTKYPMLKTLKLKVEGIIPVARGIMEIEKENKEKLLVIFNKLKNEMKQLSVGKKSIKAYEMPSINNDGIYIDRKK
ncbi:MAG: hypothetical protein ACM3TR_07140 [Caulobacteraceae bacterium]